MYLDKDLADWVYWLGRGAELLELQNRLVSMEAFERLQHGEDPRTGQHLRAHRSHDRHDTNGDVLTRGRGLYDMVVSPPKSLSIVATLYDDRLIDAHKETVRQLTQSMENLAMARVRRAGAEQNRETRNLVMAPWLHLHSRAPDAHLHTHVTVLNLTYDPHENNWKALQAVGIYRARHQLSEQYRESLSRRVEELGYAVRMTNRTPHSFELEGVPENVIAEHSRRSAQRDEAIRNWQEEHSDEITPRNVLALVRQERPKKDPHLTIEDIRIAHAGRLSVAEHARLLELVGQALERSEKLGHRPTWVDPRLRDSPEEKAEENKHLRLHDPDNYEAPTQRRKWDYGADMRGPRVRL